MSMLTSVQTSILMCNYETIWRLLIFTGYKPLWNILCVNIIRPSVRPCICDNDSRPRTKELFCYLFLKHCLLAVLLKVV